MNRNRRVAEAVTMTAEMRVTIVTREEMKAKAGRTGGCSTCGLPHDEYVKIENCVGFAADGKARYIGLECFLPISYGSGENGDTWYDRRSGIERPISQNMDGVDNTTKHRLPHVSVEFEIVSKKYGTGVMAVRSAFGFDRPELTWEEKLEQGIIDYAFCSVYVRLLFLGYQKEKKTANIEADCTVTAEGHCRFRSLQGLSRFLNFCTEEELECFRDIRCGAHIHASCYYARRSWCGQAVFKPVLIGIENLTAEERERRFGSDFRGYASDNVGGHGCAINYRTEHNTIEFRLSRIHDNEQFIVCCKWWRGVIAIVNEKGALVDEGRLTTTALGKKCARQLNLWDSKYAKGN